MGIATLPSPPPGLPACPADRNPWGSVRIGRILEDLDSLAGLVAFDHWCALAGGPRVWGTAGERLHAAGPLQLPCVLCLVRCIGIGRPCHKHAPAQRLLRCRLLVPLPCCRSDDGDPSTRPPLLVTATVEAIQLRSSQLTLDQNMEVGPALLDASLYRSSWGAFKVQPEKSAWPR